MANLSFIRRFSSLSEDSRQHILLLSDVLLALDQLVHSQALINLLTVLFLCSLSRNSEAFLGALNTSKFLGSSLVLVLIGVQQQGLRLACVLLV